MFGLSQYQMLWFTFGEGLVIGYVVAFLLHGEVTWKPDFSDVSPNKLTTSLSLGSEAYSRR